MKIEHEDIVIGVGAASGILGVIAAGPIGAVAVGSLGTVVSDVVLSKYRKTHS